MYSNIWHIFNLLFLRVAYQRTFWTRVYSVISQMLATVVFPLFLRDEDKSNGCCLALGFCFHMINLGLRCLFYAFQLDFLSFTCQVVFKCIYIFHLKPFIKKTGREKCLALRWQGLQERLVWLRELLGVLFVYVVSFLGFRVSLPIFVTWQPTALPKLCLVAKCKLHIEEWKILQSF